MIKKAIWLLSALVIVMAVLIYFLSRPVARLNTENSFERHYLAEVFEGRSKYGVSFYAQQRGSLTLNDKNISGEFIMEIYDDFVAPSEPEVELYIIAYSQKGRRSEKTFSVKREFKPVEKGMKLRKGDVIKQEIAFPLETLPSETTDVIAYYSLFFPFGNSRLAAGAYNKDEYKIH